MTTYSLFTSGPIIEHNYGRHMTQFRDMLNHNYQFQNNLRETLLHAQELEYDLIKIFNRNLNYGL